MSIAKLQRVDWFPFSDGSIRITKLGKTYNYNRLWCDINSKPICVIGIAKAEAYRLAEEELKQDTLELS